jgi:hypothetical protein
MDMNTQNKPGLLSKELAELLERTPSTSEVQAALVAATPDYDKDPAFVAAYLRAQLVEDVYRAMEVTGLNKNTLARRLGKTRQYVGRILNESANFTFRTVADLACAIGWQVNVRLYAPTERLTVVRTVTRTMKVLDLASAFRTGGSIQPSSACTDYALYANSANKTKVPDDGSKIAA